LKDEIANSQNALKFFANASERSAVVLAKIDRERLRADFRQGLLERGAGAASPTEQFDFFKELRAARVAASTGSVFSIDPALRKSVLDLFKNLGETSLPGVTGDRSGTDVFNGLLEDFARRIPGVDPAKAKKLAEGGSSEIDKLNGSLGQILKDADAAFVGKLDTLGTLISNLDKTLNTSIDAFASRLDRLIAAQQLVEEKRNLKGEEGTRDAKQAALDNFKEFIRDFGGGGTQRQQEQRAFLVGQNLPQIRDIGKLADAQQQLQTFVTAASQIDVSQFKDSFDAGTIYSQGKGLIHRDTSNPLVEALRTPEFTAIAPGGEGDGKRLTRDDYDKGTRILAAAIAEKTGSQSLADDFVTKLREQVISREIFQTQGGTITEATFLGNVASVLKDLSNTARNEFVKLGDESAALTRRLGTTLTDQESSIIFGNGLSREEQAVRINELIAKFETFEKLGENGAAPTEKALNASITTLSESIDKLSGVVETLKLKSRGINPDVPSRDLINPIKNQRGGIIGFNKGGVVPGVGTRDTVPAMLTPGEVVLPRYQTGGKVTKDELLRQLQENIKSNLEKKSDDRHKAAVAHNIEATSRRQKHEAIGAGNRKRIEDKMAQQPTFTFTFRDKEGKETRKQTFTSREEYVKATQAHMEKIRDERISESLSNLIKRSQGDTSVPPAAKIDEERLRQRRLEKRIESRRRLGRQIPSTYLDPTTERPPERPDRTKYLDAGHSEEEYQLSS